MTDKEQDRGADHHDRDDPPAPEQGGTPCGREIHATRCSTTNVKTFRSNRVTSSFSRTESASLTKSAANTTTTPAMTNNARGAPRSDE